MVGVNPEARDQCEVLEDSNFEYDDQADSFKIDMLRRNSQRKSVSRETAVKVSRRLSVGKSTKPAVHKEVKTTKADIKRFFSDVISKYVYPSNQY